MKSSYFYQSPITQLERAMERHDGEVHEGTEPDGWLTKVEEWMKCRTVEEAK